MPRSSPSSADLYEPDGFQIVRSAHVSSCSYNAIVNLMGGPVYKYVLPSMIGWLACYNAPIGGPSYKHMNLQAHRKYELGEHDYDVYTDTYTVVDKLLSTLLRNLEFALLAHDLTYSLIHDQSKSMIQLQEVCRISGLQSIPIIQWVQHIYPILASQTLDTSIKEKWKLNCNVPRKNDT